MPKNNHSKNSSDSFTEASTVDEHGECPVCKSDRYLNPEMNLLVSPCYHRVCNRCVERLFAHGSAKCPVCTTTLCLSNWVVPKFDDLRVERECRVRKRIAEVFNKREEDFETLRDYNDYLEEVEEIVFNLTNDIDVQKTSAKLEAYRKQNLQVIQRNRQLQKAEELELRDQMIMEEQSRIEYESQLISELEEEDRSKKSQQQQFIQELALSNDAASSILSRRIVRRETNQNSQLSALKDMPSLKGLRKRNLMQDQTRSVIDPFETVPQVELPVVLPVPSGWEAWFSGGRAFDQKQLVVGGLHQSHIIHQLLVAAYSY